MRINFVTKANNNIIKIPPKYKKFNAKRLRVQLEVDNDFEGNKTNKVRGSLSKYKNSRLRRKEKLAWELAVEDKYENS